MPRLFLGNLSYNVDEATLVSIFKDNGVEATDMKLINDKDTGRPRGFGFCEVKDADAAIEILNGQTIAGRTITVNAAKERPTRSGGFRTSGRDGGDDRNYHDDDRRRGRR